MVTEVPNPERLEALAVRAAAGDQVATREWVEQLYPFLVTLVRSNSSMRPFAGSEDHVQNAAQRAAAKVSGGVASCLRWRGAHPDKDVLDWVRIVSKNAIRDYLRTQLGPRTADGQPSAKRLLNEFASSEGLEERGERPPFTAAETARELCEFAIEHLSAPQLAVLSRWLEGQSFEEIAGELQLPSEAPTSLLRAAIATLRRHFREPTAARS